MTLSPQPESPWLARAPSYSFVAHLCDFLQWRFSLLPAGAYRYVRAPDGAVDNTSEIHISMDFPIRPDIVNQRPAITVFRSGIQFQGLSLGDLAYYDPTSGAKSRVDLAPTTMMVAVLSRVPVETEFLAMFVHQQLSAFRDAIVQSFPDVLSFGQRASLSPPSPPGALVQSTDVDWTAVILSFPTYLTDKHIITPLNKPIVDEISLTLTTDTPQPKKIGTVPLQGTAIMQPALSSPSAGQVVVSQPETSTAESQSSPLSIKIEVR